MQGNELKLYVKTERVYLTSASADTIKTGRDAGLRIKCFYALKLFLSPKRRS